MHIRSVGRGAITAGLALASGAVSGPAAGQAPGDELGTETSLQADFRVEVVTTGFTQPFGMAFLPDGRLLVSDRGTAEGLFIVDTETGSTVPVQDLPPFLSLPADGTGMQDVVLHPDFERNGWIYLDYALRTDDGVTMAVSRARLRGSRLVDHERLLVVEPAVPDNTDHLGSRLALRDGYLFVTMGERYALRNHAQDLSNHNGAVLRVHDDGRVPRDNPFVGKAGARPEIWSYGHRNPQGLAFHPETGALWLHEHGPKGGDEINLLRPGANYGWPVITYGTEYDSEGGGPIGEGITRHEGMEQPIYYYRPSIAPSDLVFYRSAAFPEWRGDVFIGAMALRHLNRLEIEGDRVLKEERLLEGREWRVRAVEEGPDGALYLGVDVQRGEDRASVERPGMIVRLVPA